MFAASAAGGIFVPVNPVLKPTQVGAHPRDSGARFVITRRPPPPARTGSFASADVQHVIVVGSRPAQHRRAWSSTNGCRSRRDRLCRSPPRTRRVDLDLAAILYTSGSTGRPKGVVLCHRNLIVGAESVSSYLGNTEDDVILSVLPLSFDAGFSQLTTAFAVGAHVRADELPAAARRCPAVRPAPGHRTDLRAAAVDPARRRALAAPRPRRPCGTSPTPAAHAQDHAASGSATSSRGRTRS